MEQIKIYDIAGAAGVSLATVSRVLNHPDKVKEATRNKVLRIIKERGYKPNANARGLASRCFCPCICTIGCISFCGSLPNAEKATDPEN